MAQHTAHYIGMTLFPPPFVLFYFPCINNVAHKIQCIAGGVFEKIVEMIGLAIFGAKMNVGNEYTAICFCCHGLLCLNKYLRVYVLQQCYIQEKARRSGLTILGYKA
jgi:hypothetical protein